MHQIKDQIFILQCEKNETHTIFIIIKGEAEANLLQFAELILYQKIDCKKVSTYQFETLLFYGAKCFESFTYLIRIDPDALTFQLDYQMFALGNLTNNTDSLLFEIQYCRQEELQLIYENKRLTYNLEIKQFDSMMPFPCLNSSEIQNAYLYDLKQKILLKNLDNSLLVNKNFVLLANKQITLINNEFLHQTLDEQFFLIQGLAKLPFFFALTVNFEIKFFKVNQYESYLQFMNSKFIASYSIQDFILKEYVFRIYRTELYDLEHPTILIKQSIELDQSVISNEIQVVFSSLILGVPILLNSFQIENQSFAVAQNPLSFSCEGGRNLKNNFKILRLHENPFAFIYKDEVNQMVIEDCKGSISQKLFEFCDIIDFYVASSKPVFALIMKEKILVITLKDNLKIQILEQYQYEGDIVQIKQTASQLMFLLQNCTIWSLNFQPSYFYKTQSQIKNICNETEAFFIYPDVAIQGSQLILDNKYLYQLRITQQGKILSTEKYQSVLLVFQLTSQYQITIEKYQIKNQLIMMVYKLPTFDFCIKQPLKYVIQNQYLAVVGVHKSNLEVLLVYNLQSKASNCLKNIIPIDEEKSNFDFIGNDQIYYVQQGIIKHKKIEDQIFSVPIYYFDQLFLNLSLSLNVTFKLSPQNNEIVKLNIYQFQFIYVKYNDSMLTKILS